MAQLMSKIRIGTRKSALALWQAHYVKDRLQELHVDLEVELVEIVSQGDKTLDVPLSQVGGKGLFLKELEQALLQGEIDIAVHSMKDMTVDLPHGLHIAAACVREDPRDAFVSNEYNSLADMPPGAVVGTCSLRRRCQLLAAYPHLTVENLRGNVNTRLSRLDQGQYDAIILAAAGLKRLNFVERIQQYLSEEAFLPAVGQGIVGIECRVEDTQTNALIAPLNDQASWICLSAERAANAALNGGCHVPIAVYATLNQTGQLMVKGRVGQLDGKKVLQAVVSGRSEDADNLGQALAADLIAQGADQILQQVYSQ